VTKRLENPENPSIKVKDSMKILSLMFRTVLYQRDFRQEIFGERFHGMRNLGDWPAINVS
jgi:hypothetical protein